MGKKVHPKLPKNRPFFDDFLTKTVFVKNVEMLEALIYKGLRVFVMLLDTFLFFQVTYVIP